MMNPPVETLGWFDISWGLKNLGPRHYLCHLKFHLVLAPIILRSNFLITSRPTSPLEHVIYIYIHTPNLQMDT